MKLLLIAAAAATIAATVPAAAQFAVGVGPGGASVRVGERYHDRDWRYHNHDRYSYRSHCRVERERIVTPSGRVIYRSTRICR